MTQQEMIQAIARLTAENEALKAKPVAKARKEIKASASGLVTLTGYRKFPFSFYLGEITDILARKEEILNAIAGLGDALSKGKDDPNAAKFAAAKLAGAQAWATRQQA